MYTGLQTLFGNDSSMMSHQDGTAATAVLQEQQKMTSNLGIVAAKDYIPGKETELLESVQSFMVSSMSLLNKNSSSSKLASKAQDQASAASDWFWKQTANFKMPTMPTMKASPSLPPPSFGGEEKKCDDDDAPESQSHHRSNKSGDLTPGDMDGIMDSMGYVLEVMEGLQTKAHKVATDLIEEHQAYQKREAAADEMSERVAKTNTTPTKGELDPNTASWNLQDVAKELSNGDFLIGSLLPSQSIDEYPEGSDPIIPMSSSSPTTDAFFQSMSSFMGMSSASNHDENRASMIGNGNLLTMESKLQYLADVQQVSKACEQQIAELDTILSWRSSTADVGEGPPAKPQLHSSEATEYIQTARGKLAVYGAMAENLLHDQVKCVVAEYTTMITAGPAATGDSSSVAPKISNIQKDDRNDEAQKFEFLRQTFNSQAYNIEFKDYIQAESDNEMKNRLLVTLHNSVLLRNVGDKRCDQGIRVHIGRELSATLCNIVMSSLTGAASQPHRISEWGAILFSKHVRALHAYVHEFCQCSLPEQHHGRKDMLERVEQSASGLETAQAMDAHWERLFSAVALLKISSIFMDYDQETMLHPSLTVDDARRILSLRTDFEDQDIDETLQAAAALAEKKKKAKVDDTTGTPTK